MTNLLHANNKLFLNLGPNQRHVRIVTKMRYPLNTTHNMQKTGKMVSDMKKCLVQRKFHALRSPAIIGAQLLHNHSYPLNSCAVQPPVLVQYRTSTAFKLLHWQYVHLNTIIDNIPIIQLTTVCRWHLLGVSKGAPLLGRQLEMLLT